MAAMIDAPGIELRRAGRGAPLLVIHGEWGVPGWLDSFGQLASVIAPRVPERALRLLLVITKPALDLPHQLTLGGLTPAESAPARRSAQALPPGAAITGERATSRLRKPEGTRWRD